MANGAPRRIGIDPTRLPAVVGKLGTKGRALILGSTTVDDPSTQEPPQKYSTTAGMALQRYMASCRVPSQDQSGPSNGKGRVNDPALEAVLSGIQIRRS